MIKTDLLSFKGLYITTARDYIKKLQENLEVLLHQPSDHDAIDRIYISAHSLGSQSTLVNYKNIESVCGVIERFFSKVKKGKERGGTGRRLPRISEDLLMALKHALSDLSNCVDSIEKDDKETDLSSIKKQLEKACAY